MNWSIINILMLFGVFQGLVLSLIIICKKGKRKAGKCLTLVLFAFSMNLLYYFALDVGLFNQVPILKSFYLPWAMLAAIGFYLYVTFSAPFQNKLTFINKLGFLPFVVFGGIHIAIRLCNHLTGTACILSESRLSFFYLFEELFGVLYALILGIMSYVKINDIEEKLKEQFTNFNESKLRFHKKLLILALIYCVVWLGVYSLSLAYNVSGLYVYYFLWLFLAVVIHWVAWSGFINDDVLILGFISPQSLQNTSRDKDVLIDDNNVYYQKLIKLMEEDKVFLNDHLSLSELADKVGISNSYLSLIINKKTNNNFYHFINAYRVNYFINLLKNQENKQFTILRLAYQSGFNSKSTFQASFKNQTGKTPSQFIKEHNKTSE
ncbi:helix-turn-helix domain-containing protein [Seonamhaeicola maritimus]|uniref:helix-turn-helix domain-containing protein n=1 Tax=Seonamhaeicola maritimus TaxID=2591822 RepID=UPI0024940410|nr:AraC family transcriptional regulator [Seonamhaeicola maritimus]